MTINQSDFPIDCTGDSCVGDAILFEEAVFAGSHRKPKFVGMRRIAARVVSDSYGDSKQQHTFSLEIIASDGHDPLDPGTKTRRKGRNVYRNGTKRMYWADENERHARLDDKHARGNAARAERDYRRMEATI